MNKEDLDDFLIFAEHKNMLQCPVIQAYYLYLQDLQNRFEEHIADEELMKQSEL